MTVPEPIEVPRTDAFRTTSGPANTEPDADVPGRHNAIDIAGRAPLHIVYWLVLVAAASVDAATFYQVVALVMRTAPYLVYTVVGGFTVVALALAHSVGDQARQRIEKHLPAVTSATAWILAVVWLGMGIAAFIVRYVAPGSNSYSYVSDSGAGSGSSTSPALGAFMFLTLYLATGSVAAIAGYKRPHPAIRHYRRAKRAEARAVEKLAHSRHALAAAEELVAMIDVLEKRREASFTAAMDRCRSVADRLKIEASLRIDARRQRSS